MANAFKLKTQEDLCEFDVSLVYTVSSKTEELHIEMMPLKKGRERWEGERKEGKRKKKKRKKEERKY